jgi:hypothetical protein
MIKQVRVQIILKVINIILILITSSHNLLQTCDANCKLNKSIFSSFKAKTCAVFFQQKCIFSIFTTGSIF